MAAPGSKIYTILMCLLLSLLHICSFSQTDEELKAAYSFQANDPKSHYTLIKIQREAVPYFEKNFRQNILRRLSSQWFVIKAGTYQLKIPGVLDMLPANNNFKLQAFPKKHDPAAFCTYIISVSDSLTFKNFLQESGYNIHASYKNIFLIKARPAFIIDTLIHKDYLLSAGIKLKQPQVETVINEYDNSENAIGLFFSRYPSINGNGLTVSVKENLFDTSDIDFKNRYIHSSITADTTSDHATIMATLIAGGGNSFESSKGIAWASSLSSSDFTNLLPDDDSYFHQYSISVQNNSYGTGIENFYGADAAAYDQSTIDNPGLLYVFSAGNSGTETPADGNYKGLAGFSNITGSFKQAKNILTVGSVDSFYNVASLSSKGPAYDGRIKPELVAYGNEGSSGAAAITSGTVLSVQSAYKSVHHDSLPPNVLVKAIIINSADDVFNPGPDFHSGFGNVNVANAVETAFGNGFFADSIQQDEVKSFALHVPPGISELKITLVWNDAASLPNAFKALVNDLDISLENTGDHSVYQPWVLNSNADAATLLDNAIRGRDSLNNIEQISISQPTEGDYVIHIKGYDVTDTQTFYIVYHLQAANAFTFISPVGNSHFTPAGKAIFRWNSTFASNRGRLEYKISGSNTWRIISNNINLSKKYFVWTTPDTNAVAQARITIGNKTFYSDTFDISTQLYPAVGFNCGDSALIYWNKHAGINEYAIFGLGDKYLQPIANTGDTFLIVKNTPSQYVAVAPVIIGRTGILSYTFNYSIQGVGCYISNFLADPAGANAVLKLYLGTIFNIKNVIFQQQAGGVWTNIHQIAPVSNLTLNYPAPMNRGVNLYRAIVTLNNGTIITSNEANVYFLEDAQYIVFPNPVQASRGFYVLSGNISSNTMAIFDMVGRKAGQQKITQQRQYIATSNLAKGLYMIVIYDNKNNPVFKTKIIIQ